LLGIGQCGDTAFLLAAGIILSGKGGTSPYGSGGNLAFAGAQGYGAGGQGAVVGASSAAQAGNGGAPGILLIDEFA
jgi:hypothetical protein